MRKKEQERIDRVREIMAEKRYKRGSPSMRVAAMYADTTHHVSSARDKQIGVCSCHSAAEWTTPSKNSQGRSSRSLLCLAVAMCERKIGQRAKGRCVESLTVDGHDWNAGVRQPMYRQKTGDTGVEQ